VFTEASIAKMNRKAKAAGAVGSKNPDSKNYSPKEISMLKKAAQDEINDFSRVEVRKDGVYLVMDCYKNVHPAYQDVLDGPVTIRHERSRKGGDYVQIPKDYFGGFVLEFRATIGKGGKVQFEFVNGKYAHAHDDSEITSDIVDSAAAAVKKDGIVGVREMIWEKLNDGDLIDVFGFNNFDNYESYAAAKERRAETIKWEADRRKRAAEGNIK
jgi:hypothetical protein